MHLPPAGWGPSSDPLGPTQKAPPKATGPQDKLERATPQNLGLMKFQPNLKSAPSLKESPRPWPPEPTRGSSLAALNQRALADLTPLSQLFPKEKQQGVPTPDGWTIPKNPNSTPLRPRDPFEIPVGTDDLPDLQIVPQLQRATSVRLQWPEEFLDPAYTAQVQLFQDVLTRLPSHLTVHVIAEGLAAPALEQLLEAWDFPLKERVHIHRMSLAETPEQVYHPMTMWARDGSVLCRTGDGRNVLLLPRSFRGDGTVDPQLNRRIIQGTGAAPAFLARTLGLEVRRSELDFEGGDVVPSRDCVLVGNATKPAEHYAKQFGRRVILVDPQPDFHLDLGFTWLAEGLLAVADPRLCLDTREPALQPLVKITREKGLADRYDRAAQKLQAEGLRIVRLPNLGGLGLTTPYLTYNNVLLEPGRVYMPTYGVPYDDLARQVYRQHGYQVTDIPSARHTTLLWGALRCATGELQVD